MPRLHSAPDPIAAAIGRLHRAGWTVDQFAGSSEDGGRVVVVTGSNGENLLRAEGATAAEAWGRAVEEARRLGMLGRVVHHHYGDARREVEEARRLGMLGPPDNA